MKTLKNVLESLGELAESALEYGLNRAPMILVVVTSAVTLMALWQKIKK